MNFHTAFSMFLIIGLSDEAPAQGGRGGFGGRGGPGGQSGPCGLDSQPVLTDISCSADLACDLRDGGAGVFVCRTHYDPITGAAESQPVCVASNQAWVNDQCGCCTDACPVQPDFIDSSCTSTPADLGIAFSSPFHNGQQTETFVVVCRDLYNPFTGVQAPTTIAIPSDKGLASDLCGCCDSTCPTSLNRDSLFAAPANAQKDCTSDLYVECEIRHGGDGMGQPDDNSGDVTGQTGFFVCREKFDPITGEARQHPVCISQDTAWETDTCGCCGGDCPSQPASTQISCAAADACQLPNGGTGAYVCRSHFDTVTGELTETSLCIPNDRAWESDVCGCCASGCPAASSPGCNGGGRQLTTLSLEIASSSFATSLDRS